MRGHARWVLFLRVMTSCLHISWIRAATKHRAPWEVWWESIGACASLLLYHKVEEYGGMGHEMTTG